MYKAVSKAYVDARYLDVVAAAYQGVLTKISFGEDGRSRKREIPVVTKLTFVLADTPPAA